MFWYWYEEGMDIKWVLLYLMIIVVDNVYNNVGSSVGVVDIYG